MTIQYTMNADMFNTLKLKYNKIELLTVVDRTGKISKFTNDTRWVIPENLTKLTGSSTFIITLTNLSIHDNKKEITYEYNDIRGYDHFGSIKLTVIGK